MKTHVYKILVISALCLAVAALAVSLWTGVRAQDAGPETALAIPTTINYQGFIREPDGSLTNGTFKITAKIYNVAAGGTALYTTVLDNVNVRDGLFNIVLGDPPYPLDTVFSNAPLYIGISLDELSEIIPRQRLHAVPWAFQASTLVNNATIGNVTVNGNATVSGDTFMNGNATVAGDAAVVGGATVGGDLTVTGKIARSGETSIGPHFFDPIIPIKSWGSCGFQDWLLFDSEDIPAGATAVILEYVGSMNDNWGGIKIRKEEGAAEYHLVFGRADGSGDENSWGGQGTFPVKDDGSFQYTIFDYGFNQDCALNMVGYYK